MIRDQNPHSKYDRILRTWGKRAGKPSNKTLFFIPTSEFSAFSSRKNNSRSQISKSLRYLDLSVLFSQISLSSRSLIALKSLDHSNLRDLSELLSSQISSISWSLTMYFKKLWICGWPLAPISGSFSLKASPRKRALNVLLAVQWLLFVNPAKEEKWPNVQLVKES